MEAMDQGWGWVGVMDQGYEGYGPGLGLGLKI